MGRRTWRGLRCRDDEPLKLGDENEVARLRRERRPGKPAALVVTRDGKEVKLTVTPGKGL